MSNFSHPRILVNIMLINENEDKIFFVQEYEKSYWELLGKVLDYSKTFFDCIKDAFQEINVEIKDEDEKYFKFICSFNAVDPKKKRHFFEINYLVKYNDIKNDLSNMTINESNKFMAHKWISFEDIKNKKYSVFYGFSIFLNKYKINNINDIVNLKAI